MKRFFALLLREVVEWRLLLALTSVAGLLVLAVPTLPSLQHHVASDVRAGVVVALLGLFTILLTVVLGSAALVRDLVEQRFSFFLARPLTARTLWLAKVTAAWVVLLTALGLVALPTAVVDTHYWLEQLSSDLEHTRSLPPVLGTEGAEYFFTNNWASLPVRLPLVFQAMLLALWLFVGLLVVHGAATCLRSRSWILLVDLLGLLLVLTALWGVYRILMQDQAFGPMVWWLRIAPGVLLAILLLAGLRQVRHGRVRLATGHQVFSVTLWPGLLAFALGSMLWAQWVVRPELDDLIGLQIVETAPAGPWIAVGGPARGRLGTSMAFLVDADRGDSWRLGGVDAALHWLSFAADGSRAVWPRCHRVAPLECVFWAKEAGSEPPWSTHIAITSYQAQVDLSDDGHLLAVAERRSLTVYDVATGNTVASVRLDSNDLRRVQFRRSTTGDTVVRVAVGEDLGDRYRLQVYDFDLATLDLERRGELPDMTLSHRVCQSTAGERILISSMAPPRFQIFDGDTLEPLFDMAPPRSSQWRCLDDGRVVLLVHPEEGQRTLQVLDTRGAPSLEHGITETEDLRLGPEVAPGVLALGLSDGAATRTVHFDVDTGQLELLRQDSLPLARTYRFRTLFEVPMGSPASHLLRGPEGTIQRIDPATGEVETLLGPFPDAAGDARFRW